MKDLKIYFSQDESELSEWFKKTYGEKRSHIVKEHLKQLQKSKRNETPEVVAKELLKVHFADIGDDDKRWIVKQRRIVSSAELKLEIENRLTFIKKLHPESFSEVISALEQKYPNLTKMVNK